VVQLNGLALNFLVYRRYILVSDWLTNDLKVSFRTGVVNDSRHKPDFFLKLVT
jgi:hypothetical protein